MTDSSHTAISPKANCNLDTNQNQTNKIIWQFREEHDTEIILITLYSFFNPTNQQNSTHFKWSTTKKENFILQPNVRTLKKKHKNKENETENFNHLSLSHI